VPKKKIRVLIVEDSEPTAYLIRKAFEARGKHVDWDLCFATDGEEALDCIFQRGIHAAASLPDFVLLDWNLPKVNGREVLRMLKSSDDLRTLPVLVFSSSIDDHDIEEAYNAHANGYITKPSDLDELLSIVENVEKFWVHTARLPSKKSAGSTSAIPHQIASLHAPADFGTDQTSD
jgi:two-component system, chemotaxis family, response regulator Rcp1